MASNSTLPAVIATPEAMASGAKWLTTLTIGLLIGTVLSILKRFYIRARITRTINGSDWLMLSSALFFIAVCSLDIATATTITTALHYTTITTTTQTTTLLKIATITFSLSTLLAKLSISTSLPRASHPKIVPTLNCLLALLSIFTVVFLGMTLFPCGATLAVSLTASCNPTRLSSISDLVWSASNALVGLLLLAAAVADIVVAKSNARVKLLASGVAGIGAAAVGASGVRVVLLLRPVSGDATLQKVSLMIAAALEVGLAITAGCMVVSRPVMEWWLTPSAVQREAEVEEGRARHGVVTMIESRPTTRRGRTEGREQRRREGKREQEKEWAERVERQKKRQGVLVETRELDGNMSPMGSPEVVQSIWKS